MSMFSLFDESVAMSVPSSLRSVPLDAAPVLLREDLHDVAVLTLNQPHNRNALSAAMLAELGKALADLANDSGIHAVVLAANGPAFSAGHDLKEITAHGADADGGRAFTAEVMAKCSDVMQAIVRLPQPAIAAVEGMATAAGCQLVATCDLAVASSSAGFCTPGVDIGLFCTTPMVALSRNIAPKHAMEMLLTGDAISAADAQRIGLVNRVVAPGAVRDEAIALARQIAAKSAMTVALGKRAFYAQRGMDLAEAYRYACGVMVENMLKFDAREGIDAFLQKRDPRWENR